MRLIHGESSSSTTSLQRAARDVSGVRSRPYIPDSRLFVLFSLPSIPSTQTHHPTKKKEHSLLVLPSVNTIINFATEFLECLQNYNPNIHRQCFGCSKCFGCFRCFISLLDHKTARFWSKSEQTRQTVTIQLCNNMGALSVGMLF